MCAWEAADAMPADMHSMHSRPRRTRNATVALVLGGLAFGMVGLAFAAVPLYRLFCQVTGFGGTTQVAESPPAEAGQRRRMRATVAPAKKNGRVRSRSNKTK